MQENQIEPNIVSDTSIVQGLSHSETLVHRKVFLFAQGWIANLDCDPCTEKPGRFPRGTVADVVLCRRLTVLFDVCLLRLFSAQQLAAGTLAPACPVMDTTVKEQQQPQQ